MLIKLVCLATLNVELVEQMAAYHLVNNQQIILNLKFFF